MPNEGTESRHSLRQDFPVRHRGSLRDFLQRRDGRRRLERGDWMLLHDRCGTYEVYARLSSSQLILSEDDGPLPTQDDTDAGAYPIFTLPITSLTVIELDPTPCVDGATGYMRLETEDDVFLLGLLSRDGSTPETSVETWIAVLQAMQTEAAAEADVHLNSGSHVPLMRQVALATRHTTHADPMAIPQVAAVQDANIVREEASEHVQNEAESARLQQRLHRDLDHLRSLLEAKNNTIAELTTMLRRLERGVSIASSQRTRSSQHQPQLRRPRTQAHRSTPPAELGQISEDIVQHFPDGSYAPRPATAGGVLLPVSAQLADEGIATLPEGPAAMTPPEDEDDDDESTSSSGSPEARRGQHLDASVPSRLGDIGPDEVDLNDPSMERLYREIHDGSSDSD